MSRIRFEWNIESHKIDRSDGEDPHAKRTRRRNVLRLLLLVVLLLALFALGALLVRQRLIDLQNQYAQLLQDTVKAEVAALRIGDLNTWLKIQDAQNDEWISGQRAVFRQYSELKTDGSLELTGSILAVNIEGERARVLVQENINDLPYSRLWFYQRTDSGWLHIAPDHSLWGENLQYDGTGLSVNYRAVDQQFAVQLGDTLAEWILRSCGLLDCDDLPRLTVDVVLDATASVAWKDQRNMRLEVRSPYVDIARADTPFDSAYQLHSSRLLAERTVSAHTRFRAASYPHDAYFLRSAIIDWLSSWLTRTEHSETLVRSLVVKYGVDKVAQLLSSLSATDSMAILRKVIPDPIEQAGLDWHDFIEWRLGLEAELIAAQAENEWLQLYDTSQESVRVAAYKRFNQNAPVRPQRVVDQLVWTTDQGTPQLRVTVEVGEESPLAEEIMLFNLVNDVWKRSS